MLRILASAGLGQVRELSESQPGEAGGGGGGRKINEDPEGFSRSKIWCVCGVLTAEVGEQGLG